MMGSSENLEHNNLQVSWRIIIDTPMGAFLHPLKWYSEYSTAEEDPLIKKLTISLVATILILAFSIALLALTWVGIVIAHLAHIASNTEHDLIETAEIASIAWGALTLATLILFAGLTQISSRNNNSAYSYFVSALSATLIGAIFMGTGLGLMELIHANAEIQHNLLETLEWTSAGCACITVGTGTYFAWEHWKASANAPSTSREVVTPY